MIRKFFLNHNKCFRWHLGDNEKHHFFPLRVCERRNFDFCVFLRMCSGSGGRMLVRKLAGMTTACRRPLPPFSLYKPVFNKTHYTSVRTHKNQSFSSHRPSNGKKLSFSKSPRCHLKLLLCFKKNFLITLRSIAFIS